LILDPEQMEFLFGVVVSAWIAVGDSRPKSDTIDPGFML
jgi:hypothetical protein